MRRSLNPGFLGWCLKPQRLLDLFRESGIALCFLRDNARKLGKGLLELHCYAPSLASTSPESSDIRS